MYFWIVGDNSDLIEEWLSYLHPTQVSQPRKNIVTFQTLYPERLANCAVLIKWWTIVSSADLSDDKLTTDDNSSRYATIGVETKELWSHLKKQIASVKRFKLVDLIHTDLEIKTSGTEIINIDTIQYGIVQGYQNIALYEVIDFGKPVGWMNVGMMPSKLALTLITIGIWEYEKNKITEDKKKLSLADNSLTIRDPFCGFGTTNFLVNALGYNTIASDINVTSIKQNNKRRSNQSFAQAHSKQLVLKQDVLEEFKSPLFYHADLIVSEWWLGHIVTSRTAPFEINLYAQEVKELYLTFAHNSTTLAQNNKKWLTLVISIPVWLKYEISVSDDILQEFISLWRTARLVDQPYKREKQLIGRQILIASKSELI